MQSSRMTRKFGTFETLTALVGAVLVFHGAAFAQQPAESAAAPNSPPPAVKEQAPAPAPQPAPPASPVPPDYGPPPGYQPPSYGPPQGYAPQGAPNYYGYPPPQPRYYPRPRYYAPPPANYPPASSYRTVVIGFGLGVGGLAIFEHEKVAPASSENSSRAGMGYNLHIGFGISPRWSLVFSGDGSWAYFDGYDVTQTAWTIGPQVYLNRVLYLRGGVGVATYSHTYDAGYLYEDFTDSGMAVTAAVGFEFMQGYHSSMALEFAATLGSYPNKDRVGTMGVNFILNLF